MKKNFSVLYITNVGCKSAKWIKQMLMKLKSDFILPFHPFAYWDFVHNKLNFQLCSRAPLRYGSLEGKNSNSSA
jgi:hypothetical protein